MNAGGAGVDAGGADVDTGGADVDAGIPLLIGGTGEGAGDFLGWPTGLFFMVERSIGALLLKNLGH